MKPDLFATLFLTLIFFICSCSDDDLRGDVMTDIDGNVYQTVNIGTQVWMAENLKTTKYRNGSAIPNVTDSTTWYGLATGAYCNYNNDQANSAIYGHLYNWFVVIDTNNIAPTGWHVPSDAEWQVLIDFLGGDTVAGGKIKEAKVKHWSSPNTGAENTSGFTALPAGFRGYAARFYELGNYGGWWSNTESYEGNAWLREVHNNSASVYREWYANSMGLSIRCIKD